MIKNSDQPTLDTLSDRLTYALELTGTRKADLARAIDVKPQIIQFLCTSDTKSSRFTFEIATALGLNTRWLATGEGTMFVADDPRHQLFQDYKRIPVLLSNHIKELLTINDVNLLTTEEWMALKTDKDNVFCIKMPDTSMEPVLPNNSFVFVKIVKDYHPKGGDLLLVYIKEFNTFIIRKFVNENGQDFLVPINNNFYKSCELQNDMQVLGVIIECHFSLGD